MVNVNIDFDLKAEIFRSGLLFMNPRSEKMIAEIHYFNGYINGVRLD